MQYFAKQKQINPIKCFYKEQSCQVIRHLICVRNRSSVDCKYVLVQAHKVLISYFIEK